MGRPFTIPTKPMFRGEDYTNRRVNDWLVIRFSRKFRVENSGISKFTRRELWWCRCLICNEEKEVDKYTLFGQKSLTRSCENCRGKRIGGENSAQWRGEAGIPLSYFNRVRNGAIQRGIPFEITMQDMAAVMDRQDFRCALSGVPIELRASSGNKTRRPAGTASLDRIRSEEGYTVGNIQWVHKDINLMKNHFHQSYFIEMCRRVAEASG